MTKTLRQQTRQPKGFAALCSTEMWERYGFYIMQFSLALMFLKQYKLSDIQIAAILGSFQALVYLSPIVGGYLADRILGYRHAVMLGCVGLAVGYALLAASSKLEHIYFALSVIAVGTGFVKSSMSAFLGMQYKDTQQTGSQDIRRDRGFTLYYAVFNLGEVAAGLSAGLLSGFLSWNGIYITATMGLVLGLAIFYIGTRLAGVYDTRSRRSSLPFMILAYLATALLVAINLMALGSPHFCWILIGLIVTGTVVVVALKTRHHSVREHVLLSAFYLLSISSIVFWALFFLLYSSLNLYVLRVVNHHFLGFTIPTATYASIESMGVVILGPIMGLMWQRLKARDRDLSTPNKFGLGFFFMGLTMLILWFGTVNTGGAKVGSGWLILAYFTLAAGELSLSAIGLSMVSEYVPRSLTGMMMGVWFICTGIGGKVMGLFADDAAVPHSLHSVSQIEAIYGHAFLIYSSVALAMALLCLCAPLILKRLFKVSPQYHTGVNAGISSAA